MLAVFYLTFPPLLFASWIFWTLDLLLFPKCRNQSIRDPVFIVGNPRSGTTFLYRLLAQDTQTFTCFKTWELLFAPSITQRKIIRAMAALDQRLGSPILRSLEVWENRVFGHVKTRTIGLCEPEEDELILLYIWSSHFILILFPWIEEVLPYFYFDREVPPDERLRVMTFYRECLQRHIYARNGDQRRFLSKNPIFASRIGALEETFPNARFVYVVRNPLQVLPSLASYLQFYWESFYTPAGEFTFFQHIRDMTKHIYSYPLKQLDEMRPECYIIVNYDDLVGSPEKTVLDIYNHFGLQPSERFSQILRREAQKSRAYRSPHVYSLEQFGVTREQIAEEYHEVITRFAFDQ